ncbi:MAG: enoyl-CoA hydratase/isomerase family protein [Syntrophales bacterium]
MAFRNIQFEEPEPGIGFLTLNRPDCLNALSLDMVEELYTLFSELNNCHEVRVLLIAGRGRGRHVHRHRFGCSHRGASRRFYSLLY